MTEQQIQTKIIKYLQLNNIYHFKIVVANRSGIPDIVACVDGHFLGIEVKAQRGTISKLQEFNLEQIIKSGGDSMVAYGVAEVIEMVEYIRENYGIK